MANEASAPVARRARRERPGADRPGSGADPTVLRLTTLVASVQAGVLAEDEECRIVLVNDAFCRMFGISEAPKALVGRPTRDALGWTRELFVDADGFLPRIDELVRARRPVLSEELCLADGRTFERDYLPCDADGEYKGHFWIFRDLTERARTERELAAANRALAATNRVLEENHRRTSLLNEMGDLLLSSRDPDEAKQVARAFLPRIFSELSGAAYLQRAGEPGTFEPFVLWGPTPPAADPVGIEDCWALRRRQPHEADPPDGGPVCRHAAEGRGEHSLCLPLVANDDLLGLLHLRHPSLRPAERGGDPRADRQLAHSTAEQLALSLANLQLRENLRSQALHDSLTGLHNRRYLEERLERELQRAARAGEPLAVLMLDLDRFKRINDAYGHAAGDRALAQVARFLVDGVRAEDVVARYGGEEFTLVLTGTGEEDARWVAEKLRKGVRRLELDLGSGVGESLGLSVGVAVAPGCGVEAGELLQAADAALYQAKRSGRDRVVVAAPALAAESRIGA